MLGFELTRDYKDRNIVFCGSYNLGNYLSDRISEDVNLPFNNFFENHFHALRMFLTNFDEQYYSGTKHMETNVNSIFNWGIPIAGIMKDTFSYYGFDLNIIVLEGEQWQECVNYIAANPLNPYEIRDMGEYVLVSFG